MLLQNILPQEFPFYILHQQVILVYLVPMDNLHSVFPSQSFRD